MAITLEHQVHLFKHQLGFQVVMFPDQDLVIQPLIKSGRIREEILEAP